jgi:hypothetical protein
VIESDFKMTPAGAPGKKICLKRSAQSKTGDRKTFQKRLRKNLLFAKNLPPKNHAAGWRRRTSDFEPSIGMK